MMLLLNLALICGALGGHGWWCNSVTNHIHATGLSRRLMKLLTLAVRVFQLLSPLAFVIYCWNGRLELSTSPVWELLPTWLSAYGGFCLLQLVGRLPIWLRWRFRRAPQALRAERKELLNIAERLGYQPLGHGPHGLSARLPRNELFQLEVTEKVLEVPRWPNALDGLTIAHLSDFHLTGLLSLPYFREVIDAANGMQPDLVAITGDILDHPRCFDWLPETLGRLEARCGVYFVLGNHDQRIDWRRELRQLASLGLIHVGGRTLELCIDGQTLILAGDERPWFGNGPQPLNPPDNPGADRPPRILLSHSPDRLRWARAQGFDLLLAGHTHGGQIQVPFIGPLVAPSHHGVRYASGTFHEPPTLMHVSRGISGLTPLRWNCPPEITRLVLKVPHHHAPPNPATLNMAANSPAARALSS